MIRQETSKNFILEQKNVPDFQITDKDFVEKLRKYLFSLKIDNEILEFLEKNTAPVKEIPIYKYDEISDSYANG